MVHMKAALAMAVMTVLLVLETSAIPIFHRSYSAPRLHVHAPVTGADIQLSRGNYLPFINRGIPPSDSYYVTDDFNLGLGGGIPVGGPVIAYHNDIGPLYKYDKPDVDLKYYGRDVY
ncbi:uncharacterized protein LOC131930523 [Physella acuta]|uniref:uncharacterized protein LOC131930523 n=1 Tax=Physella acuta TaxID=109671 RepID=UPI0027DD42D1|nr:uncharacterized protein LOC131930523 [Physella acuta]